MKERLKLGKITAYALPAIPISALGLPLVVHLPPFYAGATGLGLGVIGLIFMVLRFWDVITDPLMGWAADRWRIKGSRRRGWIITSVPILMLSAWMVFSPPQNVGWEYLLFWMALLYVGWTMLTISHLSWGAELSDHYHDRSRVQGIREAFLILGYLAVLTLPVLFASSGSTEARPGEAGVNVMGIFIIVLLPITVLFAVWRVGEVEKKPSTINWKESLAAIRRNRPLFFLLGSDLTLSFSAGWVSAMFLFLVRDVLKLNDSEANIILLFYFATGVIFVPVLLKLAYYIGKHKTQIISSFVSFVTLPIILFVPKGDASFAFAAWVLLGVNMAVGATLMRSMTADVCDVDELDSGTARTGMFFAFLTMTSKMGYAFSIGISYLVLSYIGFKSRGVNSDEVLLQVQWLYVLLPMAANLLVMVLMSFYPIDRKTQEENRRRLEALSN